MAYDKALVQKASAETGVPEALLEKVIGAESSGDPSAVSSKGAVGLMQLEPAAASDMGVTDRTDPTQNVMGGARYLKTLYNQFGSWPLALAAYVSGPGTVKKSGGIPAQAASYVQKVTGQMPEAALTPSSSVAMDKPIAEAMGEYASQAKTAQAAEGELGKQYDAMNARYDQYGKQIADIDERLMKLHETQPKAPGETKLPEYQPPAQKNPMSTLLSLAPMLLLFSSGMGRNKGLALMKTAGAMLNGADEGNLQKRKQYQEDFKTQLDETIQQAQMAHQRYMDLLTEHQGSASDILSGLQVLGAEYNLDHLRMASQTGKAEVAGQMAAISGNVLTQLLGIQRQAVESERNAVGLRIQQQNADTAQAREQAYEENIRNMTPLKRMQAAEKLRNDVDKTPLGKAYANLDQYSHVIDNAEAKLNKGEKLGSQEQAAFLDAFTKIVTGGQAIRGFTLKLNTEHAGLADKAQVALQQLGRGGPLSPRQEKEMIQVVSEYSKALSQEYQGAISRADDFAKQYGVIGEGQTVTPFEVDPSGLAGRAGPPVGTVENGYRFKGGDPADKSNWDKVQ